MKLTKPELMNLKSVEADGACEAKVKAWYDAELMECRSGMELTEHARPKLETGADGVHEAKAGTWSGVSSKLCQSEATREA